MVNAFAVKIHGSATIAQVAPALRRSNQADRLRRILSDRLLVEWPAINEAQPYIVEYRYCLHRLSGDSNVSQERQAAILMGTGQEKKEIGHKPELRRTTAGTTLR